MMVLIWPMMKNLVKGRSSTAMRLVVWAVEASHWARLARVMVVALWVRVMRARVIVQGVLGIQLRAFGHLCFFGAGRDRLGASVATCAWLLVKL